MFFSWEFLTCKMFAGASLMCVCAQQAFCVQCEFKMSTEG